MAWLNDVEGGRWVDDPAPTPFQRLAGSDPASQWVNSMIQDPSVYSGATDVAPAGFTNQGMDANRVMMGAFGFQNTAPNVAIESALKAIATAAGKPDFDWTQAKAAAAYQHYQQSGSLYTAAGSPNDTSWAGLIALIAQNAGDPAIAQVWQQNAPSIQQSLQAAQTQYSTAEDKRDASRHNMTFAAMAAPLAAWAAAPAAAGAAGGAGSTAALESGLAAYTPGAAGGGAAGAAGAFDAFGSLGTPLAGGLSTVPADIGAYMGTTGATAGGALGAGLGGGAATTAGTSALGRLLGLTPGQQDALTVGGQALSTLGGMYAANKQTGAYEDLANKYMAMGEPYRAKALSYENDPSLFYQSPEAQGALNATLRKLSATHGNVAGSPYAQALTMDAMYNNFAQNQQRLGQMGGLAGYNAAAPGAASSAIGSQNNFYNAIGYGIDQMTQPQKPTLAQLFSNMKWA